MPGLSQLKKFSSDLLSLGDELNIRAARGEKPIPFEIPKDVEDKNDSEEFVLGMPEIEAEVETSNADEDLSDLTALVNPSAAKNEKAGEAEPAPGFEAPDMSALLNPVAPPADDESGMPDLSMFDEPEEEPEEIVEEEPEEVSIADMGLDALLAGGGFDEPEPEEESSEAFDTDDSSSDIDLDNFEEVNDLDNIGAEPEAEPVVPETPAEPELVEPLEEFGELGDAEPLEDLDDLGTAETLEEPAPLEEASPIEDIAPLEEAAPVEEVSPVEDAAPLEDFDLGDMDFGTTEEAVPEAPAVDAEAVSDAAPAEAVTPLEDFDLGDMDFGTTEEAVPEAPAVDAEAVPEAAPAEDVTPLEDFDLGDMDFGTTEEAVPETPAVDAEAVPDAAPAEDVTPLEDFDLGDMDFGTTEEAVPEAPVVDAEAAAEEAPVEAEAAPLDDFDTSGLDDLGSMDFGTTEEASPEPAAEDMPAETDEFANSGIPDGLFDANDMDFGLDDAGAGASEDSTSTPSVDFSADDVIPDFDDGSSLDEGSGDDSFDAGEGKGEPLEVFDTSEMEGMDFGIQDTDSQLGGGESDFELGAQDDFAMEGEFEIPGFSDVTTAKEEKSSKSSLASSKDKDKGKGKGKSKAKKSTELPEEEVVETENVEDLPPNTLSDAQYKVFLQNLSEYPLNVRLAFEDFIVQDEFTDDAEFEIIEKILNKAPARQVAGMLEKMLDTSIPIPRDFEHRTAAEYEAYKKSLSYQLRNKIIPGILLGIVLMIVGWGLFKFTVNCIYRPLKANSLYKQGYELLEADEYPQAEMKFDEAASKRINKKWFFKYARGYREHKQYQRAGKMYQNILRYFKHNKQAGLEYADMELNDLANYERAEEIIRREVLDYHINDPDGILKLGDVFLEWGTEKDPEKLELARQQYATLIQLYKPNDLYLSRMMRYFIRTDNLREVLQMQKTFEPREKSLASEDWAELSGYLMDKYYGPLAPSEEYLRYEIEGLRNLLLRAVKTNPDNPIAQYNLAKYFINSGETAAIEQTLQRAIEKFNTVPSMKKRDLYKYIDSYRLLGEHYIGTTDFLQAQEQFAEGISLYTTERDNAGFEGTPEIGKLYEDMGNIKYTISGDYDDALLNYKYSVELENDSPSIRYRIGYIQYKKSNYTEALGAFMKAGDGNVKERNLMLAMANTLSLRGDDYAAQGYYNQLLDELDNNIAEEGLVFPQTSTKHYDVVNTYLYASNNYGVTLYKLAKRTGNSALNAQAIVQFSQSVRAWDALTRNQDTMVRLEGSNLAEQNIKYITHPIPDFEPSIYTDISKTLLDNEHL